LRDQWQAGQFNAPFLITPAALSEKIDDNLINPSRPSDREASLFLMLTTFSNIRRQCLDQGI
jgi:hypothetical protein